MGAIIQTRLELKSSRGVCDLLYAEYTIGGYPEKNVPNVVYRFDPARRIPLYKTGRNHKIVANADASILLRILYDLAGAKLNIIFGRLVLLDVCVDANVWELRYGNAIEWFNVGICLS